MKTRVLCFLHSNCDSKPEIENLPTSTAAEVKNALEGSTTHLDLQVVDVHRQQLGPTGWPAGQVGISGMSSSEL